MLQNTDLLRFRYSAVNEEKAVVHGVVLAADLEAAREVLMAQYAHLLRLEESPLRDLRELFVRRRDCSQTLPVYTRALASAFDAGLPLTAMFDMVAQGDDAYLNKAMQDVADSMRQGRSLSASLRRWPHIFDSTFVGMCYAAERSGRLHHTIRSLASLLEKRWRLKQKTRSALTYPLLIGVAALAIFSLLVVFVIPGLVADLHSVGSRLPWPTKVLLVMGEFATSLPIVLLAGVLLAMATSVAYRWLAHGESIPWLERLVDEVRLRTPGLGRLLRLGIYCRILSTMAALLESGQPIMEVLSCTGRASGSPVYQEHLYQVSARIQDGASLAEALQGVGAFPPLMVGVAALGEESGRLPFLLSKMADLYEEDLELRTGALVKLVEPLLLGVMGLAIGFIVLGTFLPMIELVQSL